MNNTKQISNSYLSTWHFIEDYLPNYSSRDDILRNDILFRYIDGDYVSEEDMQWIQAEFNGDKKLVKEELVRLEKGFFEESLKAYYKQHYVAWYTNHGADDMMQMAVIL